MNSHHTPNHPRYRTPEQFASMKRLDTTAKHHMLVGKFYTLDDAGRIISSDWRQGVQSSGKEFYILTTNGGLCRCTSSGMPIQRIRLGKSGRRQRIKAKRAMKSL